jgi:hypothetical protein
LITEAPTPDDSITVTLPRPLCTTSGPYVLLGLIAVAEVTTEGDVAKAIADSLNANPTAAETILTALMAAPKPRTSTFLPIAEMIASVKRCDDGSVTPLSPGLRKALEAVGPDPADLKVA